MLVNDRKEKTITIESKIHKKSVYESLDNFGEFYGFLERTLFNELASASSIDNVLRKTLKSKYISKYQIHARLFNILWSEMKGKIDSLKELDKINKKDLQGKISKYKKKMSQVNKWLIKGYKKSKSNPLKSQEICQLKQNFVQYNNLINRLTDKLNKPFKPELTFGATSFYKKQWTDEKYVNDHNLWKEEWQRRRNGHFSFIGSKDETNGNQLCQYQYDKGTLRITLPHCFKGKHLEFSVNFVSEDFDTNQQYYNYFHEAVRNKQALSYKFLKRENGFWYVQVSFSIYGDAEQSYNGTIGIDINSNLTATTEIDRHGNFVSFQNYNYQSDKLTDNQSDNLISKIACDIVDRAKSQNKSIAIEKLDLKKCKTGNYKSTNRKISFIQYGKFRDKLEVKCIKENVELKEVNPAYTSIIGKYKYKSRYGISVHNSASLVIARRANNFKEKIPSLICRVLHSGESDEFDQIHRHRHNWSSWAFLSKNLEKCLKKFNSCTGLTCTVNNLMSRFNPADYVVHRQVGTELKLVSFGNFI